MTKRLFIAEKRSSAEALADYLARSSGNELKATKSHFSVGNDTIAAARGHLLELYDAKDYDPKYEVWEARHLPIIPSEFKWRPKTDRDGKSSSGTEAHIHGIAKLLNDCDEIVHFGDAGQEGQLIIDSLLNYIGHKKPVYRLWCSGLDDTSLSRALAAIKSNEHYAPLYQAALARSHMDWLFGINMTRACTVAARDRGASPGRDNMFSVGRVQSPTLAIVVQREKEIREFKPVDYFEPWIDVAGKPGFRAKWIPLENDDRVDAEGRLLNKQVAGNIARGCDAVGTATVLDYTAKEETESAPLPFSMSSLQAHCSRLYGFGASKTLELADSLYQKKIQSYPRTDSEHIPESQHEDATRILASLSKAPFPTLMAPALRGAKASLRSRAFNDKKISDHHAIIPTHLDNPGVISELSEDEKKVYFEVVRRYLLQFWPVAELVSTSVLLESNRERFKATGKRYTEQGWRKAFSSGSDIEEGEDGAAEQKDQTLPEMKVGKVVLLEGLKADEQPAGFDSKVTKPPKRFTEGTLISAMKNIHLYCKDPKIKDRLRGGGEENKPRGIGTEATRANIIETLLSRNFMEKSGKELVPTQRGTLLVDCLPTSMTSPDMTAMWQMFMDSILSGDRTYTEFMSQQEAWLRQMVASATRFFDSVEFENASRRAKVSTTEELCLKCGSALKRIEGAKHGTFFACSNDDCKKTYDDKDGKPVERKTSYSDANAKTYPCPECNGGNLRLINWKDKAFWGCDRYKDGCKTSFSDKNGEPDLPKK